MLRKLLKVLSAVIVALSLFPLAAEPAIAAEGAYAATAAAFASYVSAGRPASSPDEYGEALRWIGLMSGEVKMDLVLIILWR